MSLEGSEQEGMGRRARLLLEADKTPEGELTAHFEVEHVLTTNHFHYDVWVTAANGWSSSRHGYSSGSKDEAKAIRKAERQARKLLNEVRVHQGAGPAKRFTVKEATDAR